MGRPNDKNETYNIRHQTERSLHREHSTALYLTSSFVFDSAEDICDAFANNTDSLVYSRYSNPNTSELTEKICAMENLPAGFPTASGMAAVYLGIISFLRSGDHIISTRAVFGSTHQIFKQILPRFGIEVSYVDPTDTSEWEAAVRTSTKLLYVESPSNPSLLITDLKKAGDFAKTHKLIYVVDNCFTTPVIQKPADYGADIVIHSATKYFDGQGRVLGGVIVGLEEYIEEIIFFARHTGPAMSPFNAWILSKSIETLALRMEKHCSNALALATALESHPKVHKVLYPHLPSFPQYELARRQMKQGGGIITIELKGGRSAAFRLINNSRLASITSNLGDSRTIITHPASTTHSKLTEEERLHAGIREGTLRISVGLESITDLITDIIGALENS